MTPQQQCIALERFEDFVDEGHEHRLFLGILELAIGGRGRIDEFGQALVAVVEHFDPTERRQALIAHHHEEPTREAGLVRERL